MDEVIMSTGLLRCPTCSGTGMIANGQGCPTCRGWGVLASIYAPCTACDGKGATGSITTTLTNCTQCKGTGKVESPVPFRDMRTVTVAELREAASRAQQDFTVGDQADATLGVLAVLLAHSFERSEARGTGGNDGDFLRRLLEEDGEIVIAPDGIWHAVGTHRARVIAFPVRGG